MTAATVHKRLEIERQNAETAWERAQRSREALARAIAELEAEPAELPDREARLLQRHLELARLERDICGPAEELRALAVERLRAFEDAYRRERLLHRESARRPRMKRRTRGITALGRPRPKRGGRLRFHVES